MENLPGIINQRWAHALEHPSLLQWWSIAVWLESFASTCDEYDDTRHMVGPLRELAAEAWRNAREMLPVEVAE